MIKSKFCLLFIAAIFISSVNLFGQENQNALPPKEKWSLTSLWGMVVDINKETREVTVMGPEGNLVSIIAGDAVKRFDEITVDDLVELEFWEYISAEFRQPTPEELATPLVVLEEGGKAPEGMDPAAAVGALIKAVVTIEVINRPEMLATVQGPRGNYLTIELEDKALIEKLNVGQVVILTYAEAVALSLTKIERD